MKFYEDKSFLQSDFIQNAKQTKNKPLYQFLIYANIIKRILLWFFAPSSE